MPATGWDGDENYALFDDKMRVRVPRREASTRDFGGGMWLVVVHVPIIHHVVIVV